MSKYTSSMQIKLYIRSNIPQRMQINFNVSQRDKDQDKYKNVFKKYCMYGYMYNIFRRIEC